MLLFLLNLFLRALPVLRFAALASDPSVRRPYPFGDVWAEYCRKFGVAADESWLDEVRKYEKDVLAKRR